MEALGQKLREARESRNVSIEQVARDTHISKQHLEALEVENFAALPGETYAMGFLRNYAEYLSLNPEEVVSLYRAIQIQEQPLPMAELLQYPFICREEGSGTREAFAQLAESAGKVAELLAEIAAASREQSQGIDQVNKAVGDVDKVTQQNAANAEESSAAAMELSSQAGQMKTMVDELLDLIGGKTKGSGRTQTETCKKETVKKLMAAKAPSLG